MIAKNFKWIDNGPIQRFFEDKVQSDFFDSSFNDPGQYRIFISGMLTRNSNTELIRRLKRLAYEFNELSTDDDSFEMEERFGTSLLIAVRPWGVGVFESLRKSNPKIF